jgi:hypothetical protein
MCRMIDNLAATVLIAGALMLHGGAAAQIDPLIPKGPPETPRPDRTPAPPSPDDLGLTAPLLAVDRFSDAAGTLLRRSLDPKLPKADEPFSLDDERFAIAVAGPGGAAARCYNLDVRPSKPNRYYVFYDRIGNYRLAQFPVIENAPGDPGYSDLWDIWKVITPDTFRETNWVRDAATVERLLADPSGGFTAASTGIYLNAPIVPEGTTAGSKAEGKPGHATRLYAWYRGKRAPFLYFEGSLHLAERGQIPVSTLKVTGEHPKWPPSAPVEASNWPKGTGYSPLARVVDPAGRPVLEGAINCPIVGSASP